MRALAAAAALAVLLAAFPARAGAPIVANFPERDSFVTGTVATSAPVSGDGSGGNPITIAAGNVSLASIATQADQTALCNTSGGVASPTACSASTLRTMIGVQVSSGITGATITMTGRFQGAQGAAVTAASTTTLGSDGNAFPLTGATTINCVTTIGWQAGSVVYLTSGSALTIANGQSCGAGTAALKLSGGADYSVSAGGKLIAEFDGTSWVEMSRSAP